MGMLINVMAAIDLLSIPEHWAQSLCQVPEKAEAIRAATQALEAHHRAEQTTNQEVPA
jgi:hypothetical protein